MEPTQAFLLGIMVAWTPSLIVLALLLRDVRWPYGSVWLSNLVRGSTEPRTNAATAAGRAFVRCASVQEKNALASVSRSIGLPVRSDTISWQMCLCGKTKTCSPLGQFRAPSRSARKPARRRRCRRDGRGPFCRSGFAAQDCQNSSQSCRRNITLPPPEGQRERRSTRAMRCTTMPLTYQDTSR